MFFVVGPYTQIRYGTQRGVVQGNRLSSYSMVYLQSRMLPSGSLYPYYTLPNIFLADLISTHLYRV